MSVMIGHIARPSYEKRLSLDIDDKDILPASLSKEVVTGLLREKLNCNGIIVTDATTMVGMSIPMPREKVVPHAIVIGCDMFLFTKNMEEDIAFMKAGVQNGIIKEERLNEAVTRVLAMKAALKLHLRAAEELKADSVSEIGKHEYKQWAKECTDESVALVKEEKGVLPISPQRYKNTVIWH